MKKLTWFFPLHQVPIYGRDHEKQKRCGTSYQSLSLSSKHVGKIPFMVWPFESGNCGKERKKLAKNWPKNKISFLEEIKTIFHNFEMLSFDKIYIKKNTEALNLSIQIHINVDFVWVRCKISVMQKLYYCLEISFFLGT